MGETPKPPTFYIYLLYNMAALNHQKTPCRYGADCYRKKDYHLNKFSHPEHPEQTMLNLKEWKNSKNKDINIFTETIEWKDGRAKREIYKAWLKWVTEKILNKQFDENEKKEVLGILTNLEEDATGGVFEVDDGKFKELLEAQGEHFKNDNGEFVFSNSNLLKLNPSDGPPRKKRRLNPPPPPPPPPKGGKKTRKPKKKTRKPKRRTRKSKTKSRKNI